jgi:hypothetical protein
MSVGNQFNHLKLSYSKKDSNKLMKSFIINFIKIDFDNWSESVKFNSYSKKDSNSTKLLKPSKA